MKVKNMRKTTFACIAVLLIAVLAITLSYFLTAPIKASADTTVLHATYAGTHGQVEDGYDAEAELKAKYSTNANAIYKITNGEMLYNYLNDLGEASYYRYAYLANDVSFAYGGGSGALGTYQFTTSNIASGSEFTKVLDGNGKTVTVWAARGQLTSGNYYEINTTTAMDPSLYTTLAVRYSGLFVGINRGTISNLTIEYNSNHAAVTATEGYYYSSGWKGDGMSTKTDGIYSAGGTNATCFGIVAGMNYTDGLIDNVRINLNNNLKVVDSDGGKGDMIYNTVILGGIVGRIWQDSNAVRNCQLDMATNTGIYGAAEGWNGNTIDWFDDIAALALTGGLVGKMEPSASSGKAILEYCAITGSGTIKAIANKAKGSDLRYRAYAGCIVGACLKLTAAMGDEIDGSKGEFDYKGDEIFAVNSGQIKNIVSSWEGECSDNFNRIATATFGQLFGSVGADVQNIIILYDLASARADRGQGHINTIDAAHDIGNGNVGVNLSWVGIYPKSEGGQVIVRFNNESSMYDVRIHAFADNCGLDDAALLNEVLGASDRKQYMLATGATGNIIWDATALGSEHINLRINNPIYAEILATSVSRAGDYTFSFGSMTTLSVTNTNGDSTTRGYEGIYNSLNPPSVVTTSGLEMRSDAYMWRVLRGTEPASSDMWTQTQVESNGNKLAGTALPGTYTINVQSQISTYTTYGYYSETQRLAAWQPTAYKYVITPGVLSYDNSQNGTNVSPDWAASAYFRLTMSSADDFDIIRYVRNGTVIVGSENEFSKNGNSVSVTIKETTGKNGMTYSFIAYALDGDKYIEVARTDSASDYLVKIDNEVPEISNISFYEVDSNYKIEDEPNASGKIAASEFSTTYVTDPTTGKVTMQVTQKDSSKWRQNRVLVKYTVVDTKSGIKYAESTSGIKNTTIEAGYSYEVKVLLTASAVRTVSYTDVNGNVLELALQLNIDYMTTDAKLTLASNPYYPASDNGYSTSGVIIRFKPIVGSSPWVLQYSCGNGEWVTAKAQINGVNTDDDFIITSSTTQSFQINWNMGTTAPLVAETFKMRMVNTVFSDWVVYMNDTADGLVGSFIVNYKVAKLYVDTSLKGIMVNGSVTVELQDDGDGVTYQTYEYNNRSLADILANADEAELNALFDKTYDNTINYTRSLKFTVMVDYRYSNEENFENKFADTYGVGVIYTPAYIQIPEDISVTLDIKLQYADANAGKKKIIATFDLSDSDKEKYEVYFANHELCDFTDTYASIDASETCEVIDANISKLVKEVNLANYVTDEYVDYTEGNGADKKFYLYYGNTFAKTIYGASVDGLEGTFDITIDSALTSLCNAGSLYDLKAFDIDDGNIDIKFIATEIFVSPKPVTFDVRISYDGGNTSTEYIPTSVSAGKDNMFIAVYDGIGDLKNLNATVEYYLYNSTSGMYVKQNASKISSVGSYKIVIRSGDSNYASLDSGPEDVNGQFIDGAYQFMFSITQGRLALAMDLNADNVHQYTGSAIAYNVGMPGDISADIRDKCVLTYTYYEYLSTTYYEVSGGRYTVRNPFYDKTKPLDGAPSKLGVYHVVVMLEGNTEFFGETYEGDMIIIAAETRFSMSNLEYSYTGDFYTFTLKEAGAYIYPVNTPDVTVWTSQGETIDMSKITIKYYNTTTRTYLPVGEGDSKNGGDGWFSAIANNLPFQIVYTAEEGDPYASCSATVYLTINPAEFKNVWIEDVSGIYNGKNHVDEISYSVPYSGATITYNYDGRRYTSLSDISIVDAGEHLIYMTVSMSGYQTTQYSATVSITKAQFSGISMVPYAGTYDGEQHYVTFNGLTLDGSDYYYTVKDEKGVAVKDSNGNDLKVKVTVSGQNNTLLGNLYAIDAGVYGGSVTLSAANYENLVVITSIEIAKVKWPVDSTWTNMPSKIPSGVSVSEYYGRYTNNSTTTDCNLIYTNSDGEVVQPNSAGILPDGKYKVTMDVGANHYIDKEWSLTVGKINTPELSAGSIVAVGIAAAVMVAAIVTSVIVVNKRKKADAIAE